MQMQVVLSDFNEAPDKEGDFYKKDESGLPIGERRSCFTGSDILISYIKQAEEAVADMNKERTSKGKDELELYPIDTTIIKNGKCFKFT